ncbi:MAG: hypothetical protein QNJ98_08370 [Planctomycetota bacterium]|nr:hypothetical protein [Planctomycetota bacterium]
MKSFGIALLWIVAIAIALLLLVRFGRRRKIVLRGRFAPHLVRLVVLVLVALGASAETAHTDEGKGDADKVGQAESDAPDVLHAKTIARWRAMTANFPRFTRAYALWHSNPTAHPAPATLFETRRAGRVPMPPRLRDLITHESTAIGAGEQRPGVGAASLLSALAEAEAYGLIDNWVCAFLWRFGEADGPPRDPAALALHVELGKRLHRHARLANALLRAKAEVKPIAYAPRVWASKGGPKRVVRVREAKARRDLLAAARRLWVQSDAGPWEREALVGFQVEAGSAAAWVLRAETGAETSVGPDKKLQLTRLDLLQAREGAGPVVLRHTWLGTIRLLPGETLRSWDLVKRLQQPAQEKLALAVKQALQGDEAAAALLEGALPLTHRAIREGVAKQPDAKGAPRLRVILTLYTD